MPAGIKDIRGRISRTRILKKPIGKRSAAPFNQGDLDSLCGVYSVVNAVRFLCPELRLQQSHSLFQVLGETLTSNWVTAQETVSLGIEIPIVHALVDAARSYLMDVMDLHITSTSLRSKKGIHRFDDLWTALGEGFDQNHVAIIGLSGRHEHWTVAYRMTKKTIRLFDSDSMKVLLRSRCSLRSPRSFYQIDPEEIILIRRGGVR